MSDTNHDVKIKPKLQRPRHYTAVFLNDDFTPMEFVVDMLMQIFHLGAEDSERIAWDIHRSGRGNAGTYTLEVAQMKVEQAMGAARRNKVPFICSAEPL